MHLDGRETDVAQGRLIEGFKLLQRPDEGRSRLLDPEQTSPLVGVHNLGVALLQQHQFKEAEELCSDSLSTGESTPDYPKTLIVGNLGVAPFWQHRNEEATVLARRASEGHHNILGPGHPWTHFGSTELFNCSINSTRLASLNRERLFPSNS